MNEKYEYSIDLLSKLSYNVCQLGELDNVIKAEENLRYLVSRNKFKKAYIDCGETFCPSCELTIPECLLEENTHIYCPSCGQAVTLYEEESPNEDFDLRLRNEEWKNDR